MKNRACVCVIFPIVFDFHKQQRHWNAYLSPLFSLSPTWRLFLVLLLKKTKYDNKNPGCYFKNISSNCGCGVCVSGRDWTSELLQFSFTSDHTFPTPPLHLLTSKLSLSFHLIKVTFLHPSGLALLPSTPFMLFIAYKHLWQSQLALFTHFLLSPPHKNAHRNHITCKYKSPEWRGHT